MGTLASWLGQIHGFGTLNALDMCWDGFRSARLLLYKKIPEAGFLLFHVFNDDEADEILDS